jgi:hypothetical protein
MHSLEMNRLLALFHLFQQKVGAAFCWLKAVAACGSQSQTAPGDQQPAELLQAKQFSTASPHHSQNETCKTAHQAVTPR